MKTKTCSECGNPAELSLCQILSTVGRTPRQQRCSTATLFCRACLRGRVNLLRQPGLLSIQEALSAVFTALADDSTTLGKGPKLSACPVRSGR